MSALATHPAKAPKPADERILWLKATPFFLVHLAPLGLVWTGVRTRDIVLCVALYFGRVFFITAGFHRYFSHRAYKMGRVMQFLMAVGGQTSCQKGVLWWSSHHRVHHKYSDTDKDVHSPKRGFWWSHLLWILVRKNQHTEWDLIKDFAKYPELVWLNKQHLVPGIALGVGVYLYGGWSALWCGFFLSTVLVYHGTFLINSVTHLFGRRRYVTTDTSRNSLILALATMGEGWHNNHHYYQSTANQGFFWWEIDLSYYILKVLSWTGLVWDLRTPPAHVLTRDLVANNPDIGMHPELAQQAAES